jgi:hypothetical protein
MIKKKKKEEGRKIKHISHKHAHTNRERGKREIRQSEKGGKRE